MRNRLSPVARFTAVVGLLIVMTGSCRRAPDASGSATQTESKAVSAAPVSTAKVDWQPYEAGLALAKAQKKPICLVFVTEWCPHCKHYKAVFEDPKVVEASRDFVMIKLDDDKNKAISLKYQPDGGYIPRTFFLSSSGELAADIHVPRPKYQFFYDENRPESILGGMTLAKQRLN